MSTGTATAFTLEALQAKLAALEQENNRLKAEKSQDLSVRIGPKGGLVVRGLGRYPMNFYAEQFPKIKAFFTSDTIDDFIRRAEVLGFLAVKGEEYELPRESDLDTEERAYFTNSAWKPQTQE